MYIEAASRCQYLGNINTLRTGWYIIGMLALKKISWVPT